MSLLRFWFFVCLALALSLTARRASAHPMGNFSINHYARFTAQTTAQAHELKLRYVLDFAEIPAADQMATLDANGDNAVSATEKSDYLNAVVPKFVDGLSLQIEGAPADLRASRSDLQTLPGAGGLPTLLIHIDVVVPFPAKGATRVTYQDSNFAGRTGWKEIIATAAKPLAIADSDASARDQSRELTRFSIDAGSVQPRQSNAQFTVVAASANAGTAAGVNAGINGAVPAATDAEDAAATASQSNKNTPQNRFTQSIAETKLTPAVIGWGLLFAFAFGAAHALSPGHGKTMVAAYLVGSRGTPRHAVTLGLVVTLTHTFGVFALGFALLVASRYVLPEKLFPALSALSGLLIFGVGLWLLMSRLQNLQGGHGHSHSHSHDGHTHHHHDGELEHSHDDDGAHSHSHHNGEQEHSHDTGAGHGHDHEAGVHVHSHGGRAHSHAVPAGPITTRTLVALGVSGGIVPCPEALVVLLAAIKLHRIGYGMVLIVAFSLGLAAALIAIGLLVVSARQRLTRFKGLGENSALVRYLPVGSAAIIVLIGAALTLQATLGRG